MSTPPVHSGLDHSGSPDRRSETRSPCSLTVACNDQVQPCSATVRDISPSGLGLVSSQPFPSGTTLTIQLRQGDEVLLSKPLRLRHVRKEGPASWFLGGSFPERLTKKEMKLFV